MNALSFIGWAFIAGCAVAAFIVPISFMLWAFRPSKPQDDRGQPTYDTEGKLTGYVE